MAINQLHDLDLNKNKIIAAAFESLGSDPTTPADGQMYFNTTDNAIRVYNGTSWDVLGSIANGLVYKGAINASGNPNYLAADAGDFYNISVAGKVGGASGTVVEVGDQIYCTVDSSASGTEAAVGANWEVIQANLVASSETVAGYIEIATQAEVTTGTDDVRAITALKLAADVAGRRHNANFGDAAANTFVITHNLGTRDVHITTHDNTTPWAQINVVIEHTSTNTITLRVLGAPPSSNQYRVSIFS
jgi:hypothetical protein